MGGVCNSGSADFTLFFERGDLTVHPVTLPPMLGVACDAVVFSAQDKFKCGLRTAKTCT
jgi:hypothetical protein